MSQEDWGIFLTSRQTRSECLGVVREYNQLLAKLDLPDEVILGVIFDIHYTYDNVRGRNWYHGIYLKLDERAQKALSLLSHAGSVDGVSLPAQL